MLRRATDADVLHSCSVPRDGSGATRGTGVAMSLAYWCNTSWMWSCRRESRAFHGAMKCVAKTQNTVLCEIVSKNVDSTFGRQHDFRSIRSPADFQQRVPQMFRKEYSNKLQEYRGQLVISMLQLYQLKLPSSRLPILHQDLS